MKSIKKNIVSISALILLAFLSVSCGQKESTKQPNEAKHEETEHAEEGIMLSKAQMKEMQLKIGKVQQKAISSTIEVNGHLEVPPQNRASITTAVGAKIDKILVIEGDKVRKGQTVAYISDPSLIKLQTDFLKAKSHFAVEKKNFERLKTLYNSGVSSGKEFQNTKAEFELAKAELKGLKAQLLLLNASPKQISAGKIYNRFPLKSPIDGAVQEINVQTGQYVQPHTDLFNIINTKHVHVDLMVFGGDVSDLKIGQKVYFTVTSLDTTLTAEIIAVGKSFEENPKAVHVHAEIERHIEGLVPGMFVSAKIVVGEEKAQVLPQDAIIKEEGEFYAFKAEKENKGWHFQPIEVIPGREDDQWMEVTFSDTSLAKADFAYNNAYYLIAEMKKGEGGGHHH